MFDWFVVADCNELEGGTTYAGVVVATNLLMSVFTFLGVLAAPTTVALLGFWATFLFASDIVVAT